MRIQITTTLLLALLPILCTAQLGDITIEADTDEESNPQVQCERWAKQDGVVGTADYGLYMEDCLNRFAVPVEDIQNADTPDLSSPAIKEPSRSKPKE